MKKDKGCSADERGGARNHHRSSNLGGRGYGGQIQSLGTILDECWKYVHDQDNCGNRRCLLGCLGLEHKLPQLQYTSWFSVPRSCHICDGSKRHSILPDLPKPRKISHRRVLECGTSLSCSLRVAADSLLRQDILRRG